jgi:hypothetical protein
MADKIEMNVHASTIINLMRYNGYSFNLAVADIIDNSITGQVKSKNVNINIIGQSVNDLYVTIQDDGLGMDFDELKRAMNLSDKGPTTKRSKDDLGKFGLGLKSASFSQCSNLIVLSKKTSTELIGMEWDLNYVAENNDWSTNVLESSAINEVIERNKINIGSQGTAVIWRNCDYVFDSVLEGNKSQEYIATLILELQKNLSLVFHKYISHGLTLSVNGFELEPMDPFCINGAEGSRSTVQYEEVMDLEGHQVNITGYLLPHITKLGGKKREEKISLNGDLMAGQGLYFYRVDRLISWGSWHNLIKKSEANKLARIEISVGNDLDHFWLLEIKKSKIVIPFKIKERIKALMDNVAKGSDRVSTRRVEQPSKPFALWKRVLDKDKKTLQYSVNFNHPLLKSFIDENGLDKDVVSSLVKLIESTFPIEELKNDISQRTYKIGIDEDDVENIMLEEAIQFRSLNVKFEDYYKTMIDNNVRGLEQGRLEKILTNIKTHWFQS